MTPHEFFPETESYETIRNRAIRSIAGYQGEWTNYNAADPGITLLELLAWMQEMQQFYLEQYETENEPLYLELLGIRPRELTPSAVMVDIPVRREIRINENTAFYADSLRFEPEKESMIGGEEPALCCARGADGELLQKCRREELQYGMWMFGEEPVPGNSFCLGFGRPVSPASVRTLYFKLEEPENPRRNQITRGGAAMFARWEMEYWGRSCLEELQDIGGRNREFSSKRLHPMDVAGRNGGSGRAVLAALSATGMLL
ncbi:MAG: hypothetical protein K2N94_08405 [Lachnospiraceae bacterium]|nr:hypothetical protein [Lachnospiraceae bacterium]